MKNLYIYLISILTFSASIAQQIPQNQNANWLFGSQSGLTFLPDPNNPTALSSNLTFGESCATVSDDNGNLLFSTNGVIVWDASENTLTNGNGLLGGQSNTQGVVILLRPGHNTYYIATIDGATGGGKGIHYSEVDMSLGTNGTVLLGNKNTPLNASNGVAFGASNEVSSEKLTTTVHSNGVDYWLVTQIADEIYSYLVTSAGIALNPVVSPAPLNTHTAPLWEPNRGVGQMKISPNTQRIGVCYYQGNIDIGENGALALGDFDNTTGLVDFDPELIQLGDDHTGYYGMEFSPNSEHAYFTTRGVSELNSSRGTNSTSYYSNLYHVSAKKTNTIKTPTLIAQEVINPIASRDNIQTSDLGLQLAINGRIYSKSAGISPSVITVINNPNDADIDNINDLEYVQTTLGQGSVTYPQWVHNHTIELCDANITLSTPEPNNTHTYAFSDFINTNLNYRIITGQDITFEAGNFIQLDANTHISKGGQCLAVIQPCGEIIGSSTTSERKSPSYYTEIKTVDNNDLMIFPNPSNDIVNLYYQEGIKTIRIVSIDGKAVYNTAVNGGKDYTVDVKNFSKGIYLINIEAPNGDVLTKKLIIK